jgi:hypothetical protein
MPKQMTVLFTVPDDWTPRDLEAEIRNVPYAMTWATGVALEDVYDEHGQHARSEWYRKIVALKSKHRLAERNDPGGKSLNLTSAGRPFPDPAGRFNVPEVGDDRTVYDALVSWLKIHGLES